MGRRARFALPFLLGALFAAPPAAHAWGFNVHRLINRNAVANLPGEFAGFGQWSADLERLSVAADERKCCVPGENIRHYIDIDDYAEFHAGTFPRSYDAAVAMYGISRINSNGTGPWALGESYEQLVDRFLAGDWTGAVAAAADIGHYAGDLHQPLHLTLNYNGQLTGQSGIHSRYETQMTNRHLGELTPFPGAAPALDSPLDRTFDWINEIYPGVEAILVADRSARTAAGGSTSSEVYYTALWEALGQDTWFWLGQASMDVASFWYTAWIDAGRPVLPGTIAVEPVTWSRVKTLVR